jgi:hypothetical protein
MFSKFIEFACIGIVGAFFLWWFTDLGVKLFLFLMK